MHMRGPRKFFQRGSKFDLFLLFFCEGCEGLEIPLKAGHHRPASETPFNGVTLVGR